MCEMGNDTWYFVGVTSWSVGCADPGAPAVYARVSEFLTFIDDVLAGSKYGEISYEPWGNRTYLIIICSIARE